MRRRSRLELNSLCDRLNPSNLTFIGGVLQYAAAPGELNTVTLTINQNTGTLSINDTNTIINTDAGANALGFGAGGGATVNNGSLATVNSIVVLLGDNNDSLIAREMPKPVTAKGGDGNDSITLIMGPTSREAPETTLLPADLGPTASSVTVATTYSMAAMATTSLMEEPATTP
jgi:hypothetical protein